jgi:hypothetical protein
MKPKYSENNCEHDWQFQPNGNCYCKKCQQLSDRAKCIWCGTITEMQKVILREPYMPFLFCSRKCLKAYLITKEGFE